MAAKRTPEQLAEVGAFVNRLYEMSGAPSWQEFARRAGVWSPNLSNWQTGTSMPEGWNLYCLIKEAALATAGQQAETALVAAPADPLEPRLRSIEAKIDATRNLVARGFDALELELPDEERPPQDGPQAQPR